MTSLTPAQRRLVLILTFLLALTRIRAIADSMWDWDEACFTAGVTEYDPALHRPHPPGYPLFIAAARPLYLAGVPPFRALQAVVFAGAVSLFPLLFLFARSLGFRFRVAVSAAVLFALLPNVWVYGGTAFSDVPAIALAFASGWMLLRGRESRRDYLIGTVLLAIAIGVRPQNLIICFVPGVLATWWRIRESWKTVAAAALLGATIVGATYGIAALSSTSVEWYIDAWRTQAEWVRNVDSWRSPTRPPLLKLIVPFFLKPVQQNSIMLPLLGLGLVGAVSAVVRRSRAVLITVCTFLPVAVVSWLNFDLSAAGRYAIAYLPMHALLAAEGMDAIATSLARTRERIGTAVMAVVVTSIAIWFVVWTRPALRVQRTTTTPPVAAMEWIRSHVPPGRTVYLWGGLRPFGAVFFEGYNVVILDHATQLPPVQPTEATYFVVDRADLVDAVAKFTRPHDRLWQIVRPRNFEASVVPVISRLRFGSGWYSEESGDGSAWRWMQGDALLYVPAVRGKGRLMLQFFVPNDTLPTPPTVTIYVNGVKAAEVVAKGDTLRQTLEVLSLPAGENEVRITTSAVVNPQKLRGVADARDLGLRLDASSWAPIVH